MPDIPNLTELDFLKGLMLCQVATGKWDLQLHFERTSAHVASQGEISINGQPLDLVNGSKLLVDCLGESIMGLEVTGKRDFNITFSSGLRLTLHSDDSGYESYQIYDPAGELIFIGY
jgi:hypothetical protein